MGWGGTFVTRRLVLTFFFRFLVFVFITDTAFIEHGDTPEVPEGVQLCLHLVNMPSAQSQFYDIYRHLFNLEGCIHLFLYDDGTPWVRPDLRHVAQRSGQPTVLVHNPRFETEAPRHLPAWGITNGAETTSTNLRGGIRARDVQSVVDSIAKVAMRLPHVMDPINEVERVIGIMLQRWGQQYLHTGRVPIVTINDAETYIHNVLGHKFLDVERCLARISAAYNVQVHPMSGMVLLSIPWVFRHVEDVYNVMGSFAYPGNLDSPFDLFAPIPTVLGAVQMSQMHEWLVRCKIGAPLSANKDELVVFPGLSNCDEDNCFSKRGANLYSDELSVDDFFGGDFPEEALVFDGITTLLLLWEVVRGVIMSDKMDAEDGRSKMVLAHRLCFLMRVKGATIRLAMNSNMKRVLVVVSGPACHNVIIHIQGLVDDVMECHPFWVLNPKQCVNLACTVPGCGVLTEFHTANFKRFRERRQIHACCDHDNHLRPCARGLKGWMCQRWSPMRSAWIGAVARGILRRRLGVVYGVDGCAVKE